MRADRAAVHAYRSLTILYPRSFRHEYRDDLIQLFGDQCRDEPVVRVCARAALDLTLTIPTEHLEVRMNRPPNAIVPWFFVAIAIAGLILAGLGGTEPVPVIVGLCVAAGAGALAAVSLRRAAQTRPAGPPIARAWWKFLVAGPTILALGAIQMQLEVGSWYVWMVMVLSALVLTAIGVVLGVIELASHRSRPSPA